MKVTKEIESLFKKCRSALGAPLMEVELLDEQLCDLLELSIEDYAEKVQNWMIENQWATLYGKDVSNTDMAYALSVRTLDISKDFSYWFSKDAGLQQRGPWELKKDYFTVEEGKQSYLIPAGREINNVMYCNPSTSQAALYANYGGLDTLGFAGGYGQAGGGSYGPIGGFYIAQSCDIAYMATDLAYKNRLLRGDLTYKVTAGPDGTHIIHLYSTPGSKLTFGATMNTMGSLSLVGTEVWYTYYDVTPDNVDECRRQNPNVILTPDQVPLENIDYAFLNPPTKVIIRKIFIAKAKQTLALIRGKFSGKISIMDAEAVLDYQMLASQGAEEYKDAMDQLDKRLERMNPYKLLEQQANLVDSMEKILRGKPLKMITV
nr:MAG TPA: hypothetical protein [Myoviridae sp. ctQ2H14]